MRGGSRNINEEEEGGMAEQKEAVRTVMWNGWTVANEEEEGGWLNRNEEGWPISSCCTLSRKKNLCYFGRLYTCLCYFLSRVPSSRDSKREEGLVRTLHSCFKNGCALLVQG